MMKSQREEEAGGRTDAGTRPNHEESAFDVPYWLDFLGGLIDRHPSFWIRLGRLESRLISQQLAGAVVSMPIYVCGLARSGTTLLHEVVASHPSVATHRVKDYPLVFTPYWWRRATARWRPAAPRERAHRDGILITTESPDALEEMLWMAFFPGCHDPSVNNVLGSDEHHPAFESFYRNHIRKLLLAERLTRYAAKANYHVARLAYLIRLFPDAKFLIAVRSPEGHIASLRRQQEWFRQGHQRSPRALSFMQRTGHFEFGLDRRPMNLGDTPRVEEIIKDWAVEQEVRGLARYWDMVYSHLARLLETDTRVRAATLVVRFETLCQSPAETLQAVLRHCELSGPENIIQRYAPLVRQPAYYSSNYSADERSTIRDATEATAKWWGYPG